MFDILDSLTTLELLTLVEVHGAWVLYFVIFLTGEIGIFLAALLMHQGQIAPAVVYPIAFLAAFSIDVFWFLAGRYFPAHVLPKKLRHVSARSVGSFMSDMFRDKVFLPIVLLKFFYGTRIVSVVYFARTDLSFWRFCLYEAVATLWYVWVFVFLGDVMSMSVKSVLPYSSPTTVISVGALVVLLCIWLAIRLRSARGQIFGEPDSA
jgi:membrane protein DedA with SNARE-associated domain